MMPVGSTFRLGDKIGAGAFGYVFQACETSTGRVVALKKSRASLIVRRTILHHEARILRLLAGHPSIPPVFAYGRLQHFEYLAMELLGRSLGNIVEKQGRLPLKSVLQVANQMLSALEHIHSRRIVHRDIKPNNIITHNNDPSVVYLIDFGLARPCLRDDPSTHNLIAERRNIVGTLTWASLNAHNGIDLGPRDDLESLAYTFLFLLRGELPWQKHCEHGTVLGRIAQIREKKHAWTGSRLAKGHPPVFGQLLDYARGLKFDEPLDYGQILAQFEGLLQTSSLRDDAHRSNPDDQFNPSQNVIAEACKCPVEVGQLVQVQIVSRISIEGYSMQAGDPSYWHDPSLSSDEWRTSTRPAIVINATFDQPSSSYKILVVSLGRGVPAEGSHIIPVSASPLSPSAEDVAVVPEPSWPMPETYCYAFPRATWFYCIPGQARAAAHWKIGPEGVRLLQEKFAAPLPWSHWSDTQDAPDLDVRYDTRMKTQSVKFFVKVIALGPANLESPCAGHPIDWQGDRGWFDERVRIARRRGRDNGVDWTASDGAIREEDEGSSLSDSYFGADYSLWGNRQQERDRSLTLDLDQQELYHQVCGKGELEKILEVV